MVTEISENGLCFVSGRSSSIGEEVTLAWRFSPEQPALQVTCVVRSTAQVDSGVRSIQTGVEFLNITRADRLRIIEFVSRRAITHQ